MTEYYHPNSRMRMPKNISREGYERITIEAIAHLDALGKLSKSAKRHWDFYCEKGYVPAIFNENVFGYGVMKAIDGVHYHHTMDSITSNLLSVSPHWNQLWTNEAKQSIAEFRAWLQSKIDAAENT